MAECGCGVIKQLAVEMNCTNSYYIATLKTTKLVCCEGIVF